MARATEEHIRQQIELLRPAYGERYREFVRHCLGQRNDAVTEAALDRFAAMIPDGVRDATRLTLLYDALRRHVTYDYDETCVARFTYPAALFRGRAVCIGIADLFSILCQRVSLECRVIVGYAGGQQPDGGGLHAWNLVRLAMDDGVPRWYHCDPTWDLGRGARRYFLKSDEDMEMNDHRWRKSEYPSCTRSAQRVPHIPEKAIDLTCQAIRKACTDSN